MSLGAVLPCSSRMGALPQTGGDESMGGAAREAGVLGVGLLFKDGRV